MAETSSLDSCIICSNKHNRIRPSLCQCKHCSKSFCFDCMKDHNDELQQNVAQLLNQYNELKQVIKTKAKLITDETIKSKEQMNEWFRKSITNLNTEKARIDLNIEKAEKEAQKYVHDIDSELQTLSADIEGLTKNGIYRTIQMDSLLEKIDQLDQQLSPLAATRDYDLPLTMPKYNFTFNCSIKSTTDTWKDTWGTSEEQPNTDNQYRSGSTLSDIENSENEDSDIPFPDENYFCNRDKFEQTSYVVDCMASDGINIMYSTIEDTKGDLIAYCYLDNEDSKYRLADPSRAWHQSRIIDMIWWDSIDKFICATENGVYTVEYTDDHFKIMSVINIRCTNVRVATNTDYIWIHAAGKITIYNINFELVRSMNYRIPYSLTRASFCLTDNLVAFAFIRRIEKNRDILHIEFYDCDMKKVKRVRLGLCETSCVIRTDGNDRFYVAIAQQKFFIVSPNGNKQTINLGKQASSLAVVNSQSIVLTKSRSEVELVKC